jgi:hypothetical protein
MLRVSFYSALALCLSLSASNSVRADGNEPKGLPNTKPFGGLTMGVGLSLTHDLGWNDRITKAQIVNNIVRVDEERNDLARIMLELHYFFTPDRNFGPIGPHNWGHGPFIAIEPSKENVIGAIGLGWMIGFRNNKGSWDKGVWQDRWDNTSWNFGIGFVVDPNSKILGDGFRANQPPPPGENAVRLKDTSQGGVMFITSFSY